MMQKEEKIVVILLIMAVLSLIIGYFGFSKPIQAYSDDTKLEEKVYVEGEVLSKKMTGTGDHLILTISSLKINIFVPNSNGAIELYNKINTGDRVGITGKVSQFKNEREIIVENARDIILL